MSSYLLRRTPSAVSTFLRNLRRRPLPAVKPRPYCVPTTVIGSGGSSLEQQDDRATDTRSLARMSDDRPSEVLGSLPRTRPHRRSEKRAARASSQDSAAAPETAAAPEPTPARAETPKPKTPARAKPKPRATKATVKATSSPKVKSTSSSPRKPATDKQKLRQPAQPAGTPAPARPRKPAPSPRTDVLGTAVQAAAELAEIGLSVGARAIRRAVSRLPRP